MPKKTEISDWYANTELGEDCQPSDTHCAQCEPNGNCDFCNTIDVRWIEAVSDYASTCDGPCMQLTLHESMARDPVTGLAYCEKCKKDLPKEIKNRLE